MTDQSIEAKGYAHPDVLVSVDWLAEHLGDANLRILESDEDVLLYDVEHIPGAQKIDWHADLNDPVQRDYVSKDAFQALLRRLGIDESATVIFYGDKNNWWAAYAFWVFQLFGFSNAKLLDGGRAKWLEKHKEDSKRFPLTTDVPKFPPSSYVAPERTDTRIRAFMPDVHALLRWGGKLVDVRSPQEYTGEKLHMPDYPQEGTLRGGHIPTARSVPWARAANPDGTFKSADELRAIYEKEQGLSPKDDVIAYCRIGERSSHTWFVLTHLLGYDSVRNYDGSWTEWGNAVRSPIRVGAEP